MGVAFPLGRPLGDHAPSLGHATTRLKPLVASRPGQQVVPATPRVDIGATVEQVQDGSGVALLGREEQIGVHSHLSPPFGRATVSGPSIIHR